MIEEGLILKLIGKGKVKQALELLIDLSHKNEREVEYRNCLLLLNEYSRLHEERMKNTISFDEHSLRVNSIIDRLLSVHDEMESTALTRETVIVLSRDKGSEIISDIEEYFWGLGKKVKVTSNADDTFDNANIFGIIILGQEKILYNLPVHAQKNHKIVSISTDDYYKSMTNEIPVYYLKKYGRIDDLLYSVNEFFSGIVPVFSQTITSERGPNQINIGYKANIPAIIHLLIGKALYKDKYIFIRELLQNSVDACIKRFGSMDSAKIGIRIDTTENYIEFIDNGCGISMNDFRGAFGTIGKELKTPNDKQSGYKNADIIGQFGIGFISVFMVSKKIQICTKSLNDEIVFCSISDVSKKFEFKEKVETGYSIEDYGSTIRVYLTEKMKVKTILEKIKHYYRLPNSFFIKVDGEETSQNSTRKESGLQNNYYFNNRIFEAWLRFGFNNPSEGIIYCNNGFYINRNIEWLGIDGFPFLKGYINFRPNAIDLTVDRHSIIKSNKIDLFYKARADVLVDLMNKTSGVIRKNAAGRKSDIEHPLEVKKVLLGGDSGLFDIINPMSRFMVAIYQLFYNQNIIDPNIKYIIGNFESIDEVVDIILDITILETNVSYLTLRELINISKYKYNKSVYYLFSVDYSSSIIDQKYNENLLIYKERDKLIVKLSDDDYSSKIKVFDSIIDRESQIRISFKRIITRILFMFDIKLYNLGTNKGSDDMEEIITDN